METKQLIATAEAMGLAPYLESGRIKIEVKETKHAVGMLKKLCASLGYDVKRDGTTAWAVWAQDGSFIGTILTDTTDSGYAYFYTTKN